MNKPSIQGAVPEISVVLEFISVAEVNVVVKTFTVARMQEWMRFVQCIEDVPRGFCSGLVQLCKGPKGMLIQAPGFTEGL